MGLRGRSTKPPEVEESSEEGGLSLTDTGRRKMGKETLALRRGQLELKRVQLELDDRDKARDDRRATIRTIFAGIALILALGVVTAALYFGREFDFSGFGFHAATSQVPGN